MVAWWSLGRVCVVVLAGWLAVTPARACEGAYCERTDKGSCGNACCKLEWGFHQTAQEVMSRLNSTLHSGGPDGLYKANALHEGGTGFTDLRSFGAPAAYVGQGTHTTVVKRFNDTLNFAVYQLEAANESKVTAFSISNLGGSLGDEGQNYSNLKQLIQSSGLVYEETTVMGCPSENVVGQPSENTQDKMKATMKSVSSSPSRKSHLTQKLRLTRLQTRMNE